MAEILFMMYIYFWLNSRGQKLSMLWYKVKLWGEIGLIQVWCLKKRTSAHKKSTSTTGEGHVLYHFSVITRGNKMWVIVVRDPWKGASLMVKTRVQLQQPLKRQKLYMTWVTAFYLLTYANFFKCGCGCVGTILLQLDFEICIWKCIFFPLWHECWFASLNIILHIIGCEFLALCAQECFSSPFLKQKLYTGRYGLKKKSV